MDPTTLPQAGPVPAQGTNAPGGPESGPEPQTFSREYVQTLRQEAAAHRTEAAALKAEKEDRERQEADAKRTAAEQADAAKADAKQARADLARARAEIAAERTTIGQARTLNFAAPDAVWDLISARVEYDRDQQPTNVEALLKGLAEKFPGLLSTPAAPIAPRGGLPTNTGRTPPTLTPPVAAYDPSKPPSWSEAFKQTE